MNELNIVLTFINGVVGLIAIVFGLRRLFRGPDEMKLQQPITVQQAQRFVSKEECVASHLNIIQRVDKLEKRTDEIEHKIDEQTLQLAKDGERRKDELIAEMKDGRKEQAREIRMVHERINPLLDRIGHIDGQLNAVTRSVNTIEMRTKL